MFFVPEGFAHGYLVTSQESIVLYKCTNIYNAEDEHGIRWDDATIGLAWGKNNPILSERDKNLPTLKEQKFFKKHLNLGKIYEEREQYIRGYSFQVDDEVIIKESGEIGKILICGSNYVIVEVNDMKFRKCF